LLRCVTKRLVPMDARRLARHQHTPGEGVAYFSIDLLTPGSTGTILKF